MLVSILITVAVVAAAVFVLAALWQILRTQGEILAELKELRAAATRERDRV